MVLPRLVLLDVSCNQLETLPKAVGQLAALKQLRAQGQRPGLVQLPPELGSCAALEELDVSSNSLMVHAAYLARPLFPGRLTPGSITGGHS